MAVKPGYHLAKLAAECASEGVLSRSDLWDQGMRLTSDFGTATE